MRDGNAEGSTHPLGEAGFSLPMRDGNFHEAYHAKAKGLVLAYL